MVASFSDGWLSCRAYKCFHPLLVNRLCSLFHSFLAVTAGEKCQQLVGYLLSVAVT
nr:MAG TPA: hypothetical protein [Caudoviricetes sp.]